MTDKFCFTCGNKLNWVKKLGVGKYNGFYACDNQCQVKFDPSTSTRPFNPQTPHSGANTKPSAELKVGEALQITLDEVNAGFLAMNKRFDDLATFLVNKDKPKIDLKEMR